MSDPLPDTPGRVDRRDAGKYVFKPFYGSSHWCVLREVAALGASLRICDVGAGEGFLAGKFRDMGHSVVGLDRFEPAGTQRPWTRFVVTDLATAPTQGLAADERFDVIVMADVIEHLPRPLDVLKSFVPHLERGGSFVVSVPNVAHLVIRVRMLAGRFDYEPRGIMDEGHLRFFTLKSFRRLLHEAGLAPRRIKAAPVPLPLIWPRIFAAGRLEWVNRLAFGLSNAWRGLFAYQFVAVAGLETTPPV